MFITSFRSRRIEKQLIKTHKYPEWAIVGIPPESYGETYFRIIGFNPEKLILDYFEQETKNFEYALYYDGHLYYHPWEIHYYAFTDDFTEFELKLLGRFIMKGFLGLYKRQKFKSMHGVSLSAWSVLFERVVIKYAVQFKADHSVIEALKELAKYTRVHEKFMVTHLPQFRTYLYPDMTIEFDCHIPAINASYSRDDKRRCFAIKTLDPQKFKDYEAYMEEFRRREKDPSLYDDAKFLKKYDGNREVSEEDYQKFAVTNLDK